MSSDPHANPGFPSTHWSAVERAGREHGQTQQPALSDLLRRYLPALRAHLLMRRSAHRDQVDDLLQGFVSSKVLEADLVGRADRSKGKFRSLLLTALDRYVISQRRYDQTQKRGASRTAALDDTVETSVESKPPGDADTFDVAWARQVLQQALTRMQAQCETDGRPDVWGVFESRILGPALENVPPAGYEQIVARFGYRAPTQMWNAVRTGKQLFARMLRAVIAEYTGSDEQVEAELNDLRDICARLPQDEPPSAYP